MKNFFTQRFVPAYPDVPDHTDVLPKILGPSSQFRIMITAMQMKMQTLVFPAQKIVRVALVEQDRGKEDRGRRDEVGETEDEIGRKQEGIDVIKKKMIHLKSNCQRYILIN